MSTELVKGPAATSFDNTVKRGWLTKQGGTGFKKNWRRRWFVLEDNYIYYYKSQEDKEPVGIICLDNFLSCKQSDAEECKKSKFCWKLTSNEKSRVYYAYADNKVDMNSWIEAIGAALAAGKLTSSSTSLTTSATGATDNNDGDGPKLSHITLSRPVQKHKRAPSRRMVPTYDEEEDGSGSDDDRPISPTPNRSQINLAGAQPVFPPRAMSPPPPTASSLPALNTAAESNPSFAPKKALPQPQKTTAADDAVVPDDTTSPQSPTTAIHSPPPKKSLPQLSTTASAVAADMVESSTEPPPPMVPVRSSSKKTSLGDRSLSPTTGKSANEREIVSPAQSPSPTTRPLSPTSPLPDIPRPSSIPVAPSSSSAPPTHTRSTSVSAAAVQPGTPIARSPSDRHTSNPTPTQKQTNGNVEQKVTTSAEQELREARTQAARIIAEAEQIKSEAEKTKRALDQSRAEFEAERSAWLAQVAVEKAAIAAARAEAEEAKEKSKEILRRAYDAKKDFEDAKKRSGDQ